MEKIIITESDLPLRCPPKGTPVTYCHPLQFFDIVKTGEAKCPYCSNHYVYQGKLPSDEEMYEGNNHVIEGT